jgi:hypothetical protein
MTESSGAAGSGERYWTYWVAYRHRDGMGAAALSLGLPLRAACQLAMLAARIEREEGVRDVVVLSWQELSAPEVAASLDPLVDAMERVLAAGDRMGSPVSSLSATRRYDPPEIRVHLQSRASIQEAEAFLAVLGFVGTPEIAHIRGERDFVTCTGYVDVADGGAAVIVFCEEPA